VLQILEATEAMEAFLDEGCVYYHSTEWQAVTVIIAGVRAPEQSMLSETCK
jgi:hypothetical protein